MNRQQDDKQVIKQHLEPEWLNDDAIDRKAWGDQWYPLFVRGDGVNAVTVIGGRHCLVHRSREKSKWRYYHLPEGVHFCAMGRNSPRLWFITNKMRLAAFDLDSEDWLLFQHKMPYEAVLHADRDTVIAQRYDMLAIDTLSVQGDQLRRSTSIDIPSLSFSHYVCGAVFLPGKDQFLILDMVSRESVKLEYSVRELSWDGRARTVLNTVEGDKAVLRFPFVVVLDREKKELLCSDLRRTSKLRWTHFKLNFASQGKDYDWQLMDAFPFGKGLVITLEAPVGGRRLLLQLENEIHPLYEGSLHQQEQSQYTLMGQFLISEDGFIYDLVRRGEVKELPFSRLLRHAVQDEIKRQRRKKSSLKPAPVPTQGIDSSEIDVFKASLCELSVDVSEAAYHVPHFLASPSYYQLSDFVSSQKGDTACFVNGRAHLLLGTSGQVRRIQPELQHWWRGFTFDEQGRAWLYNKNAHYIAVITPDKKEGYGFVLSPRVDVLRDIAAYGNKLALLFDNSLVFYHYDGRSLEEEYSISLQQESPLWIKPDGRGWWVASCDHQGKSILSYLEAEANLIETKMEVPYNIKLLGDQPGLTYFVYVDNDHRLHYTIDPHTGWQVVSLQDVLGEQEKSIRHVVPVSMHNIEDETFLTIVMDESPSAFLLMRLQAASTSIISAFDSSTRAMRWGDWLVFYNRGSGSISLKEDYITLAEVDVLPPNEGVLFYHPATNHFSVRPQPTYSVMKTLGKFALKADRSPLKHKLL